MRYEADVESLKEKSPMLICEALKDNALGMLEKLVTMARGMKSEADDGKRLACGDRGGWGSSTATREERA
jgi:hypothetical protein